MKRAIKLGEGYLPTEVKEAVRRINKALDSYDKEFVIDPYDMPDRLYVSRPFKHSMEKEYIIAENHEGGASATVFRDKQWFYRDSWEGRDTPVPGGIGEVVANWVCYFTA